MSPQKTRSAAARLLVLPLGLLGVLPATTPARAAGLLPTAVPPLAKEESYGFSGVVAGTLWVATQSDVYFSRGDRLVTLVQPQRIGTVRAVEEFSGTTFLGTKEGLFEVHDGLATRSAAQLPESKGITQLLARGEKLAIGSETGFYWLDAAGVQQVPLPPRFTAASVSALAGDDRYLYAGLTLGGSSWLAMVELEQAPGLARPILEVSRGETIEKIMPTGSGIFVLTRVRDAPGQLFLLTSDVIRKIQPAGTGEKYFVVQSIAEFDGAVYAATTSAVFRLENPAASVMARRTPVNSLLGTIDARDKLAKSSELDSPDLGIPMTEALYQLELAKGDDGVSRLFLGTSENIYELTRGSFEPIPRGLANPAAPIDVRSVFLAGGHLWVTTANRGVLRHSETGGLCGRANYSERSSRAWVAWGDLVVQDVSYMSSPTEVMNCDEECRRSISARFLVGAETLPLRGPSVADARRKVGIWPKKVRLVLMDRYGNRYVGRQVLVVPYPRAVLGLIGTSLLGLALVLALNVGAACAARRFPVFLPGAVPIPKIPLVNIVLETEWWKRGVLSHYSRRVRGRPATLLTPANAVLVLGSFFPGGPPEALKKAGSETPERVTPRRVDRLWNDEVDQPSREDPPYVGLVVEPREVTDFSFGVVQSLAAVTAAQGSSIAVFPIVASSPSDRPTDWVDCLKNQMVRGLEADAHLRGFSALSKAAASDGALCILQLWDCDRAIVASLEHALAHRELQRLLVVTDCRDFVLELPSVCWHVVAPPDGKSEAAGS